MPKNVPVIQDKVVVAVNEAFNPVGEAPREPMSPKDDTVRRTLFVRILNCADIDKESRG